MSESVQFDDSGRLPAAGDNVAIAIRRLEAGTTIVFNGTSFVLDHTVLEGHRFAVELIQPEEPLLSWGLPFGMATRPIMPGNYVHNADMLAALAGREIDFELPTEPNFRNEIKPYRLDESTFKPGKPLSLYAETRTFQGYPRPGERGVGTRNYVVILSTSARTAGYVQLLARKMAPLAAEFARVDGITAVAHTEGDGQDALNNRNFVLRTLAGFIIHPNVGAVLVVDYGTEQINNEVVQAFMEQNGYDLAQVRHRFLRLSGEFEQDMAAGTAVVENWLPQVNEDRRAEVPLAQLNIALQCGGSDAFSGVSGNPLVGSVAREVIRYGGKANLAETDELIGAEPYMMQNMRDVAVARKFLRFIAEFKARVGWHGVTAEGNPSGGNRYRGLYNIALKSIGAAMKRHPEVRLDEVVDYAEPMKKPGFYFMNTPGNDLESIAGQVAGGSNMIFFVTGNGSITNFPFVPTIKVVTTTPRFNMLAQDMDVNAGAYQDGRALADLTQEMLDLTIRVASGEKSKGEQAGHSQVSIWRNWRQTDDSQLEKILSAPTPSGRPLTVREHQLLPGNNEFEALRTERGVVSRQVDLILPTSLCAGQIARLCAERLNQSALKPADGQSQFVSLVHTEGCGFAIDSNRDIFDQTMLNYMAHPLVRFGLFLEHGCEKTHNDYMRHELEKRGLNPADFGWASIQLDGGIEAVMQKIGGWFGAKIETAVPPTYEMADLSQVRLGLMSLETEIPAAAATAFAQVVRTIVTHGGSIVMPETATFSQDARFVAEVIADGALRPSLAYGQAITAPGLHLMEAPSRHWSETITGLGATGVELILAFGEFPFAGHPFIPLLWVGQTAVDVDLRLTADVEDWAAAIMALVTAVLSRHYTPKVMEQQHVNFQLTRGLLGVST